MCDMTELTSTVSLQKHTLLGLTMRNNLKQLGRPLTVVLRVS